MIENAYIQDILEQPYSLRLALNAYQPMLMEPVVLRLRSGDFQNVILTGLGSSNNGTYPAYLQLCQLDMPVNHWTTAELLHYGMNQITEKTLLWITSQSGQSAEIVHLVEKFAALRPGCVVALTNDTNSVLARAADVVMDMKAGNEYSVATKTYVHTLAIAALMATQLGGGDVAQAQQELLDSCALAEEYISHWQSHKKEIDELIGEFSDAMIMGRGPSMAGAWNGSLNQKEAARVIIEGINSAEFRHGPLELAAPGFILFALEGSAQTSAMNHALAKEVVEAGGKAIWIGQHKSDCLPTIQIPAVPEIALPISEILPFQMLTLILAERQGIPPGQFRHIGKVVLIE